MYNDCGENSICINTFGGFICECKKGNYVASNRKQYSKKYLLQNIIVIANKAISLKDVNGLTAKRTYHVRLSSNRQTKA